MSLEPLSIACTRQDRRDRYAAVTVDIIEASEASESWQACLELAAARLHRAFSWFHFTGFEKRSGVSVILGPFEGCPATDVSSIFETPVLVAGREVGRLRIESRIRAAFDETDRVHLELLCDLLAAQSSRLRRCSTTRSAVGIV